MEDPTSRMLGSAPPEAPEEPKPPAPRPVESTNAARPSRDPRFMADAMRSLYQSGDSSIVRGDATRVISRTLPDVPEAPKSPSARPEEPAAASGPPAPRVDVTLWVVLALGLFAIAGVMLSAAL